MSRKLLATRGRWLAGALGLAALAAGGAGALPASMGTSGQRIGWSLAIWAAMSAAFGLYLRGEEARLARELRIARSGTPVQRGVILRRRRPAPYFGLAMFWYAAVRVVAALGSTTLGYAAVLIASGELDAAEAALGGPGRYLSFGALRELRTVVEADAMRAIGSEASLGEAIRALYAMPAIDHVEAERYRIHVLVRALLEQGDLATARSLVDELAEHPDEDRRVYAV